MKSNQQKNLEAVWDFFYYYSLENSTNLDVKKHISFKKSCYNCKILSLTAGFVNKN